MASYADARSQNGKWMVRIEDVDELRCQDGAERQILATLTNCGMSWDGELQHQSDRKQNYARALECLVSRGVAFRCNCSRNTVAASGRLGPEGPIYPGTCRATPPPIGAAAAWRARVEDRAVSVADRICGAITQNLAQDIGDFIIKRIDGYTAYQLAVVVDDQDQGISHVVRGADLLWSTPRQVWLQDMLGYRHPQYAHVPLVYGLDGHKLSKRDSAHPIDDQNPLPAMLSAWSYLGQVTPAHRIRSTTEFWQWSLPRWHIDAVPKDRTCADE